MADREALDMFLGDMAGHQVAHAAEPTPDRNQAMAAAVFERLDQKQADAAGRLLPAVVPDAPPPPAARPSRLEAAKRGFAFQDDAELGAETPIAKVYSPRDLARFEKVQRRVELLMTKVESGPLGAPSWRDRLMAAQSLTVTGRSPAEVLAVERLYGLVVAEVHRQRGGRAAAAMVVAALVEESNAAFGHWQAEKPQRIQVG